ncbi:MAG: amidase family protein, partial [Alphaproteobacteria bacterium]|nr:amidase family protein [Alphaproteobacteria bacterium]
IHGIRTTQDRIPVDGVHPLAPCFDTIGWFARGGALMQAVGRILLPGYREHAGANRLLVARDCFDLMTVEAASALDPAVDQVAAHFQDRAAVRLSPDGPDNWMPHFRTLQMADIWRVHGEWVQRVKPKFGPGVAERFAMCATITPQAVAESSRVRETVRRLLRELLADDGVLCLPTAPGIAPLRQTPEGELDNFRWRSMGLTCIAGLSGCPQINLPLASLRDCPLGLSLLAAPGRDEMLLQLAAVIAP